MNNKYDEPPAYSQSGAPQPPQPSYQGSSAGYYQQGPPPPNGYYGGPQMAYGQPQPGPYPQYGGPYGQPYGPQPYGYQGGYYDDRRGAGPGACEGILAALACCCCLDCLLF